MFCIVWKKWISADISRTDFLNFQSELVDRIILTQGPHASFLGGLQQYLSLHLQMEFALCERTE